MQLESTTIKRFCKVCGSGPLRSDQRSYCSRRCASGGEFRIEYLDRIAASAEESCCVEWPYGKNAMGYGVIDYEGSCQLVHRVSFIRHKSILSTDECALHKCDNPSCFNPHHLFKGSRIDNNADRVKKGRGTKGVRVPACKLNDEQVSEIRRRWIPYKNAGLLAKEFGVSRATIGLIATGVSQKHTGCQAVAFRKNRLTTEQWKEIFQKLRLIPRPTVADLAKEYGINPSSIYVKAKPLERVYSIKEKNV